MSNFKIFIISIGCLLGVLALGFGLQYFDLVSFGFFAPKYENVRRKTFENTQSYVQGKIQDLSSYKAQYEMCHGKDSTADRAAIKSVINSQFANFDKSQLPDGLETFLYQIRGY